MTKKILSEHEKKAWKAMCDGAGVDSGLEATARKCDECGVKDESVKNLPSGWLLCADCYRGEEPRKHSHYHKNVSHLYSLDVYRILELYNVTDPCLQHIVKKALCAGQRGAKDFRKDVQEIADTANRKLEMLDEDAK